MINHPPDGAQRVFGGAPAFLESRPRADSIGATGEPRAGLIGARYQACARLLMARRLGFAEISAIGPDAVRWALRRREVGSWIWIMDFAGCR